MNELECSICNEKFNDSSRRPRNMPCGHGFCSLCIDSNINKGSRACPVCRKEHNANSASDLPICFLIEELLHNSTISTSEKNRLYSDNEEDEVEICSKHKKIPVYFHCKSHGINVCHSCAVLVHQPTKCHLISLEDLIEEKKEAQVTKVQFQKQVLDNTEKDFKLVLNKNMEEIKKLKQDIIDKEKYQIGIKNVITGCQARQYSLEIMTNRLKSVTSNRKVESECKASTSAILQCQKWEEAQRRKLNVSTSINAVKDTYVQIENNGIIRSSKAILVGSKTLVPTLSKGYITSRSASVLMEADLHLTSATTTVFMDFSTRGQSIGRMFIRIKGHTPLGQQFIMLALGTNGAMFKTCNFDHRRDTYIALKNYVKEDGSCSRESLLPIVRKSYTEMPEIGRIYPWYEEENKASFLILTKSASNTCPDHFGVVLHGMNVIDTIYLNHYTTRDVTISECGIVLNY